MAHGVIHAMKCQIENHTKTIDSSMLFTFTHELFELTQTFGKNGSLVIIKTKLVRCVV